MKRTQNCVIKNVHLLLVIAILAFSNSLLAKEQTQNLEASSATAQKAIEAGKYCIDRYSFSTLNNVYKSNMSEKYAICKVNFDLWYSDEAGAGMSQGELLINSSYSGEIVRGDKEIVFEEDKIEDDVKEVAKSTGSGVLFDVAVNGGGIEAGAIGVDLVTAVVFMIGKKIVGSIEKHNLKKMMNRAAFDRKTCQKYQIEFLKSLVNKVGCKENRHIFKEDLERVSLEYGIK